MFLGGYAVCPVRMRDPGEGMCGPSERLSAAHPCSRSARLKPSTKGAWFNLPIASVGVLNLLIRRGGSECRGRRSGKCAEIPQNFAVPPARRSRRLPGSLFWSIGRVGYESSKRCCNLLRGLPRDHRLNSLRLLPDCRFGTESRVRYRFCLVLK